MPTLYELKGDILRLYELSAEMDDEQAFIDTLESIKGDVEVKAEGIVSLRNQLKMEMQECDRAIEHYQHKKEVRKHAFDRITKLLQEFMETTNMPVINAGDYTIKLQNNGGSLPLIIDGVVPENYMKIKYEPDGELIRKAIADGKNITFAHLAERGKHIRIS